MIDKVKAFIAAAYQTAEEHPWTSDPDSTVYRDIESGKWFVLLMKVKKKVLGIHSEDDVWVMNVKAHPDFVQMISGMSGVYPAYHMNKTHWITVMLDGSASEEFIYDRIAESYTLITDTATKRIYQAVKKVPRGKVASYGQIAALAGDPKMSRAVGNALHKNPDPENIPCYRIVNAKGELAGAFAFGGAHVQEDLLKADGIEVINGKVDLNRFGIDLRDFMLE